MPDTVVKPVLAFLGQQGQRVGEDRFHLLEAIDQHGSISAAAKAIGVSYRGAWDAVNALNNLFPQALVRARPGGRYGGNAEVTPEGKRAIAMHRLLSEKLANVLAELDLSLSEHTQDLPPLSSSLWSLAMKTSARNVFHGVISEVNCGAVNAEVLLQVSATTTLVVIMTIKSALALGIHPGREAFAMIKASSPILMPDNDHIRTSARNRLPGTVVSVESGAINSEVVMDIGNGKTLVTIITNDSAESMEFKPGERVCALVKSSQIILGVE
ncbi:TOBE domain-containing protein [Gynuella sp.]|uniref:TOBE domain-containing protein n=1 Tax=Gynuella sp. TaxID=2969146 RepID=UPI003D0D253D